MNGLTVLLFALLVFWLGFVVYIYRNAPPIKVEPDVQDADDPNEHYPKVYPWGP